jgi:hypothetical protein
MNGQGRLLGDANDAFTSGPPVQETPKGAPRPADRSKLCILRLKNGQNFVSGGEK